MTRKELDRLDVLLARDYGAVFDEQYYSGPADRLHMIRFYQSTTQRILVEVRDGKWAIYTHHHSEGPK